MPALAGCADTVEGIVGVPDSAQERTLPWGFENCRFVVAVVPVDAEALADHLPDGFRALPPAEAGLPNDPRGDATLGVELFRCERGASLNGTLEDVPYGSVFTFVEPPAHLVGPAAKFHFVKWETLEPDAARRAVLAAAGAPVVDGDVAFVDEIPIGAAPAFSGTLEMNGTYTATGTLPAPGGDDMKSFSFVEFMEVPNGLVVWRTLAESPDIRQGSGTLQLPEGFARDVVGEERAQAYLLGGTVSFRQANVTLPGLR